MAAVACGATAQTKNGFDLSFSLVPRDQILQGGPPRDGIPALTRPEAIRASDASHLRPDDVVIGVELNGAARAYPLRILVWHEAANDVLGGAPIAVTYCPLCNSALVFDRRVAGQTLELGVSGLLYQSNVLLYDRARSGGTDSLWNQIQMRAVTGPAAKAGQSLRLLPSSMTTWSAWRAQHPETTVLSTNTGFGRDYAHSPYGPYFASDELMFPVDKKQHRKVDRLKNKDPMVLVSIGEEMKAYAVKDIAVDANQCGYVDDVVGGERIRLYPTAADSSARVVTAHGDAVPVAYLYWFSLDALLDRYQLYEPRRRPSNPAGGAARARSTLERPVGDDAVLQPACGP
jgi:hypothetical protein